MNITILNGNPDVQEKGFDRYIDSLSEELKSRNHSIILFILREMKLKSCTGCFGCWVKTPGECFQNDDTRTIRRDSIRSDFILFASPVIMGFTSALLKNALDKFLPLLLPYVTWVNKELHHVKRYDRYPPMGLLMEKSKQTDYEDIQIITDIYKRSALNFRSTLPYVGFTGDPIEEAADAIDTI